MVSLIDTQDASPHVTGVRKGHVVRAEHQAVREYYLNTFRDYQIWIDNALSDPTWMDFPMIVSIETLMKCNAACHFCPYPDSDRKGEFLEDHLVIKIIDDVAQGNEDMATEFSFCRVNEPFLDKRIFDFFHHVRLRMPNAKINHFSNATPLTDKVVDKILDCGNTGYFRISFNDHRPRKYYETMQIDFNRTYKNVKRLHDRKAAGEFDFTVIMGRVGDGSIADIEFIEWVKQEFPLFDSGVHPQFDWLGKRDSIGFGTPETRCSQWFQLNFLANGKEAFCCIDDSGAYGSGDIRTQSALEIYNAPQRRHHRKAKLRTDVEVCRACNAWL